MKAPILKSKKSNKVRSAEEQEKMNQKMALLRAKRQVKKADITKEHVIKEQTQLIVDRKVDEVVAEIDNVIDGVEVANDNKNFFKKMQKIEKTTKEEAKERMKTLRQEAAKEKAILKKENDNGFLARTNNVVVIPEAKIVIDKDVIVTRKGKKIINPRKAEEFINSNAQPILGMQTIQDGSELVQGQLKDLRNSIEEKKLLKSQIDQGSVTNANKFLLEKYGVTSLGEVKFNGYNNNKHRLEAGIELEYHIYYKKEEDQSGGDNWAGQRPINFMVITNPIIDFKTNDVYYYHFPIHYNPSNNEQYEFDNTYEKYDIGANPPVDSLFSAINILGEQLKNNQPDLDGTTFSLLNSNGFFVQNKINLAVKDVFVETKLKGMNNEKKFVGVDSVNNKNVIGNQTTWMLLDHNMKISDVKRLRNGDGFIELNPGDLRQLLGEMVIPIRLILEKNTENRKENIIFIPLVKRSDKIQIAFVSIKMYTGTTGNGKNVPMKTMKKMVKDAQITFEERLERGELYSVKDIPNLEDYLIGKSLEEHVLNLSTTVKAKYDIVDVTL